MTVFGLNLSEAYPLGQSFVYVNFLGFLKFCITIGPTNYGEKQENCERHTYQNLKPSNITKTKILTYLNRLREK